MTDINKDIDTTWSDLTSEERRAKFTSTHLGITDVDVKAAWDEKNTVNGVAKLLGCSKVNARRRLTKLGLKKPNKEE